MTLQEAYSAIAERVDDPDKVNYANRYEEIFITAMAEVIRLQDDQGNRVYSPEEYPELAKSFNFETRFSNGWFKKNFDDIPNLMYILNVYTDPDESIVSNITQKRDFSELQHIANNAILAPAGDEIFWGKRGNAIFILSNVNRELRLSADVILNPIPTDWGTQDLVSALHYGRSFLAACITRAAQILRQEIGLE